LILFYKEVTKQEKKDIWFGKIKDYARSSDDQRCPFHELFILQVGDPLTY
jgi:hypothetical protein